MDIPVEWIGGAGTLLLGVAAKALQMYRRRARSDRPLFENGERAAVQQALHLIMEAHTGTANRVTTIEVRLRQEIEDARQEHSDLRSRIENLEEWRHSRRKSIP